MISRSLNCKNVRLFLEERSERVKDKVVEKEREVKAGRKGIWC